MSRRQLEKQKKKTAAASGAALRNVGLVSSSTSLFSPQQRKTKKPLQNKQR